MLFTSPFAEVRIFLDEIVGTQNSFGALFAPLSKKQRNWISMCITAMVLMSMFYFAKIQRASGGKHSARAFSWMLQYSKICWEAILEKSVLRLINLFGLKGFLVIDDSDRLRAKSASTLFVTEKMTFPVGFRFFIPDPDWVA